MLATTLLSVMFVAPAEVSPQEQVRIYVAAGEAHLERAAVSGEQQLDEFDGAHKNFDLAYLTAYDPGHLCRALQVAELVLATVTFTDPQPQLSWEEVQRDDLERLREDAVQTGRGNCRHDAHGEPTRVRVALLAADDPPMNPAMKTPLAAPRGAVFPMRTAPSRGQVHRQRAHTALGAVLTGTGIGMLGILSGVLELERQRAIELRGIIQGATAAHRGFTAAEERRYFDLGADLLRGRDVAIGVGVAGLVSLGTGVALLVTRQRTRPRTYALHPYGGPQGAGGVLRLRF